jgi:hypothetical protein
VGLGVGGGVSLPRGYAGLSQGNTAMIPGAHLLVYRMSPKQVWSQHLVVAGTLLFSQCNVAGEAFYKLGVQVPKF